MRIRETRLGGINPTGWAAGIRDIIPFRSATMSTLPPSLPAPQGNVVRQTIFRARLILRLMRDGRVRWLWKLIPIGGLAYVIFPFDLITDFAPIIGQLDDLGIFFASLWLFVELCPPDVVKEHWDELAAVTVKGSWREVDTGSLPEKTEGKTVPDQKPKNPAETQK
jgi:uncharacterized membrane protein YkvA (DUF1232 family)